MKDWLQSIENEVKSNKVVLYMKGSKSFPMCGFSAVVCQILEKLGVDFKDVNVLEDENLRVAIKQFSDWPTIPQLYINGEFIGGSDIAKQLYENGELQKLLNKI
jgi:monothiol glutaredoxin